jgi:hypothetical protein
MDIKSPRLLYLKGALFVLCGSMAAALILFEHPSVRLALLLALTRLVLRARVLFCLLCHPALRRSGVPLRGSL